MFADVAEHVDDKVGAAVHHRRDLVEFGTRLDIAAEPEHARDAVEIAVRGRRELCDQVDRAEPRGEDAVGKAAVGADNALDPATGMGRSEEHTSELQSLMRNSYAVFCLNTKTKTKNQQ